MKFTLKPSLRRPLRPTELALTFMAIFCYLSRRGRTQLTNNTKGLMELSRFNLLTIKIQVFKEKLLEKIFISLNK